MKSASSVMPERTVKLQKNLKHELESWHELLAEFQGYHDDELEFDLNAAKDKADHYLKLLSQLQNESFKSIKNIKSKKSYEDGIITSLMELRKINVLLKKAIKERERLRKSGSHTLLKWLADLI